MAEKKQKKIFWLALAGSLMASFILYWGTLHGAFVLDDNLFAERLYYRSATHLLQVWTEPYYLASNGIYRPLASFTFNLNFVLFGEGTTSFHVVNLILNGLAIWLVFVLIYKLFKNYWLSFFSAAFFAVQPFHRIPAGNIKNRDETMAAIFTILAVLAFMKAREYFKQTNKHDRRFYKWMSLSAIAAFLALISKEMAIAAPLIILGVYYLEERPKLKEIIYCGLWYAPLTIIFLFVRWRILGHYAFADDTLPNDPTAYGSVPFLTGLWTAGKIAFIYLSKMFVPYDLTMDYTYNQVPVVTNILKSWQAIAGYLALAGMTSLMFLKKEKYRPVVYGAALFLIPYIFVSKLFFKFGGQIVEENWMYLPSLGISLIVGWLLYEIFKRQRKAAFALCFGLVAFYGYIDISSNHMWTSKLALAQDRVAHSPNSADAHFTLASSYLNMGDIEQGKKELDAAAAIYSSPDMLDVYGEVAMSEGKYQQAADYFKKSLDARTQINSELHYALALGKLGKYRESIKFITPLYIGMPDLDNIKFILAYDYYKLGKVDVAKRYVQYYDPEKSIEQKLIELEQIE